MQRLLAAVLTLFLTTNNVISLPVEDISVIEGPDVPIISQAYNN